MSSKRILWVTPKWTLPINDGARVATDALVRNVIAAGAEVDVFSFYDHTENVDTAELKSHWGASNVFVETKSIPTSKWGKRWFYLKQVLASPTFPLTFAFYRSKSARDSLQKVLAEGRYAYVILEGLHPAVTLWDESGENFVSHGAKVIVRAHNVESDLWEKAALDAGVLKRLFLRWQYQLVLGLEKLLLAKSNGIAAISREDAAIFQTWTQTPLTCIPLGLNFNRPLDFSTIESDQFLFIGRLDWMPNRQGLGWLLEKVWPQVVARRPKAKLKVVGVGDSSWLNAYLPMDGVELIGRIPEVKSAYASAAFCVAPLFFGSGTRIKIIEAFAMNRRLISTRMGVQGAEVQGDMFVAAETEEEWIERLSTIQWNADEQSRLAAARKKMAELFDERAIGERAYAWIMER